MESLARSPRAAGSKQGPQMHLPIVESTIPIGGPEFRTPADQVLTLRQWWTRVLRMLLRLLRRVLLLLMGRLRQRPVSSHSDFGSLMVKVRPNRLTMIIVLLVSNTVTWVTEAPTNVSLNLPRSQYLDGGLRHSTWFNIIHCNTNQRSGIQTVSGAVNFEGALPSVWVSGNGCKITSTFVSTTNAIATGMQRYCDCGDGLIAGINLATSGSSTSTYCAAGTTTLDNKWTQIGAVNGMRWTPATKTGSSAPNSTGSCSKDADCPSGQEICPDLFLGHPDPPVKCNSGKCICTTGSAV